VREHYPICLSFASRPPAANSGAGRETAVPPTCGNERRACVARGKCRRNSSPHETCRCWIRAKPRNRRKNSHCPKDKSNHNVRYLIPGGARGTGIQHSPPRKQLGSNRFSSPGSFLPQPFGWPWGEKGEQRRSQSMSVYEQYTSIIICVGEARIKEDRLIIILQGTVVLAFEFMCDTTIIERRS
jgi:hypothetical protein